MSSHDLTLLDTPSMATSHDGETIALSLPVGCACGWSTTLVVVDPTPERIDVAVGFAVTGQLWAEGLAPRGGGGVVQGGDDGREQRLGRAPVARP